MSRKILIFSYWFPPNNAIGASRGAAMARFFHQHGWEVTVIAANSAAVPTDFDVDLAGIEVHRVDDTARTRLMNFRIGRPMLWRLISAVLRYFSFPDVLKSTTTRMGRKARDLIGAGHQFDVVLSSALPFSQHDQARRIAKAAGAVLVLDNRDTWAGNAYRRRPPFSDRRERRFEHSIFRAADFITAISDKMTEYYKDAYPTLSGKLVAIRNGADAAGERQLGGDQSNNDKIEIVYTGILYGAKRDVRPVLVAARRSGLSIVVNFYGSEADGVAQLQREFPDLDIIDHGRVSRDAALKAQRNASILLVALGIDEAEKTFLPGKFFEYVQTGLPIAVLADSDYEISALVEEFDLGVATRDVDELTAYFESVAAGNVPIRQSVPAPLTREYQLAKLQRLLLERLEVREAGEAAGGE